LALPKSVDSGNLSVNKVVIRWMSHQRNVTMLKSVTRSLVCITLIFIFAFEAWAGDDADVIVNPDEHVAGYTQLFWAQTWWQWVLSIPNTQVANPLFDPNGNSAAIGNTGPVFFLVGTFGGSATRTITIPFGKPVFSGRQFFLCCSW
jgi:hypothetical protein